MKPLMHTSAENPVSTTDEPLPPAVSENGKHGWVVGTSRISGRPPFGLRQILTPAWFGAAAVLFAFFTHFYQLGDKPLHHDESLFAYYSHYMFKGNGYLYQPILHGPVLENVVALIYLLFSDTDFTMRLWSAVGGMLLLLVAWYWRGYLGRIGVVAAIGFIAFSPSLTYYSRFLRNDVPYLTVTCWCALCLVRAMHTGRERYIWAAVLSATLAFSMMESSIFFFAACVGYLGVVTLTDWLAPRRKDAVTISASEPLPVIAQAAKLRIQDYLLIAAVAAIVEFAVAWLFHRMLYASIHIYKPLLALLKPQFPSISARDCNWIIVALVYPLIYLFCLAVAINWRAPRGRHGALHHFLHTWWKNKRALLGAVCLGIAAYAMLFTTYFTNTSGPEFNWVTKEFDGPERPWTPVQIYKNTWDYWWNQHSLHRIKGPFHFYLPILFLYEAPAVAVVCWGWIRALRASRRFWTHIGVAAGIQLTFAAVYLLLYLSGHGIDWEVMDKKFHLTSPPHLFLILLYCQILTHLTGYLFLAGRRVESFITFWMVTSLFAYSYAGEKVPWLTVHTVGPLCLLAGIYIQRLWSEARWTRAAKTVAGIALCLALVWQTRSQIFLNFIHPHNPAERLVYNHTTPDIKIVVAEIDKIAHSTLMGNDLPMYIKSEAEWPLYWYLRDYTNAFAPHPGEDHETTTRPVVLVDWEKSQTPNLVNNYDIQRLKLREWWEPSFLNVRVLADIFRVLTPRESRKAGTQNAYRLLLAKLEWGKLLHYLSYREIWVRPDNINPELGVLENGANEIAFCVRKNLKDDYLNPATLAISKERQDIPRYPQTVQRF